MLWKGGVKGNRQTQVHLVGRLLNGQLCEVCVYEVQQASSRLTVFTGYTGPTCEIQVSAYFVPATSATLDLDPELDLTQIAFQLSLIEPSGIIFYVVSFSSVKNYYAPARYGDIID